MEISMDSGDNSSTVAFHRAGSTDPDKLDQLIERAWSEAKENPIDRAKIEKILGLTEQELDDVPSPFRVKVESAGLTGAEIIIMLATAFATAYAKEIGSAAAKSSLQLAKKLWPLIKDRIVDLDPEAIGSEVDQSD
jgi:hypothetical protein